MKKLKLLALLAAAALFFSCSQPASSSSDKKDDKPASENPEIPETPVDPGENQKTVIDENYTQPELPDSVGEDPLKGKTYIGNNGSSKKFVFNTDGTIDYYEELSSSGNSNSNSKPSYGLNKKADYSYNYDSTTNTCILYVRITASKIFTNEVLTYPEILTRYKSFKYEDYVNPQNPQFTLEEFNEQVNKMILQFKLGFETLQTWKVDIQDGSISILDPYFTSKPDLKNTLVYFQPDATSPFNSISFEGNNSGIIEIDEHTYCSISNITEKDFTIISIDKDTRKPLPGAESTTKSYTLSLQQDGRCKLTIYINNDQFLDFYTRKKKDYILEKSNANVNNGLDPSINKPVLPDFGNDTTLAGRTFRQNDEQQYTISFGNDGTYTTSYLQFDNENNARIIKTKCNYAYDSSTGKLYSTALAMSTFSESENLLTFEEIYQYFNTLSYEGSGMSSEQFNALISELFARIKMEFEFTAIQVLNITDGTNGTPATLTEYVYYPSDTSISNRGISFKLASSSSSLAINSDDGESYINPNGSSDDYGLLEIPFIKQDESGKFFNQYKITKIDSDAKQIIVNSYNDKTEAYTLSYSETYNDGIVTLFFNKIENININGETYYIPSFSLSSDKESVYEEVNMQS